MEILVFTALDDFFQANELFNRYRLQPHVGAVQWIKKGLKPDKVIEFEQRPLGMHPSAGPDGETEYFVDAVLEDGFAEIQGVKVGSQVCKLFPWTDFWV